MLVRIHGEIVRAALSGVLAPEALRIVVFANQICDLYQWAPERHFDNGRDSAALDQLWRRGLHAYLTRAIARCAPTRSPGHLPTDRRGALRAFGMATHALADFYAHTNWIELLGAEAERAPLLGDEFPTARVPAGLQSGYYSLRYGLKGCPSRRGAYTPPPGYRYCHEQLNKDAPDRGHGAEQITPGTPDGPTYHEVAVRLATAGTRDLWEALQGRLAVTYPEAERLVAALARRD